MIATDLDGTLLRSDGTVSPRTRDALHEAREQGRVVVLATGRPIRYVRELAIGLELKAPVVCANGAIIYDAAADEVVVETGLPLDVYNEVLDTLRTEFEDLAFAVETARSFVCEPAFATIADWPVPDGSVCADGSPLCDAPPAKLLVRHPTLALDEAVARMRDVVSGFASVTYSTPHLVEIAAIGVDKGAGLGHLAHELGFGAADVVAFGDMPNDVAMLEWAGRAVAVANAHIDVLAVADEVTDSNNADGVARVIESLDT